MSIWYYISAVALLIILLAITKKVGLSLLIPYVFLVFAATVFNRTPDTLDFEFRPLVTYCQALRNNDIRWEIICNILMFVPVGIFQPMALREHGIDPKLGKCVLNGLYISVLIELLQLVTHRGFCEIDDVISNMLGMLIGFGLYVLGSVIVRLLYGKQTDNQYGQ